jgi:hypothetical protein
MYTKIEKDDLKLTIEITRDLFSATFIFYAEYKGIKSVSRPYNILIKPEEEITIDTLIQACFYRWYGNKRRHFDTTYFLDDINFLKHIGDHVYFNDIEIT